MKGDFGIIKIGCKRVFHIGVQFLHIAIRTVLMTFERGNIQELRSKPGQTEPRTREPPSQLWSQSIRSVLSRSEKLRHFKEKGVV
jgi:hypothetical protein